VTGPLERALPLVPGVAVPTADVKLPLEPLPADEVVAGQPRAGAAELGVVAGADVGIWEMTAGVARDVEVDEVFVVLSGSATVGFEDGSSMLLRPGDVARLAAGSRTTWSVHEPLRKVYITPATAKES
jgi:uncharacterized cupin superfamily protein